MTDSKRLTLKKTTNGDAAVDGLFSGVVAGLLMAAYLALIGLARGEGPGLVLGRFDPGEGASPLTGILAHLAVAGVYGILFAMMRRLISRWRRPPAWLAGLLYGIALLVLAKTVSLRVAGVNWPLLEIPGLHFALAHGVYGLTLGFLLGRQREIRP